MQKTKITKQQVTQALQTNSPQNFVFANKSLRRKHLKAVKDLEQKQVRRENFAMLAAKKNNKQKFEAPKAVDMSDQTDEQLIQAIRGLGFTADDLIKCNVDPVRAIELFRKNKPLTMKV